MRERKEEIDRRRDCEIILLVYCVFSFLEQENSSYYDATQLIAFILPRSMSKRHCV